MDDRPSRKPRPLDKISHAQLELIAEIVSTAECVAAAKTPYGSPIYPNDAVSKLLRCVERAPYCCAIADAARLLGVSRQRAQEIARKAEQRRLVELLPNPDDRRLLQIFLTPDARSWLESTRRDERQWAFQLLLGLDDRQLAATTHVIRTIRHRLRRDERERLDRHSRERRERRTAAGR